MQLTNFEHILRIFVSRAARSRQKTKYRKFNFVHLLITQIFSQCLLKLDIITNTLLGCEKKFLGHEILNVIFSLFFDQLI